MTETTAPTDRHAARASWLRAKWARERAERAIERLSLKIGEAKDGETKRALSGEMKTARSLLSERKTIEAKARKAYDATK